MESENQGIPIEKQQGDKENITKRTIEQERNKGGNSKVGKASNLNRFRTDYDKLLKKDYFGENPIYSSAMFRRRFRMRRLLFEKILDDLVFVLLNIVEGQLILFFKVI